MIILTQLPPIPRTNQTLPLDKLSPRDFERLCLWLVQCEGYENAEHWGAAGSEQGRDIIAWRNGRLWTFQCKRVQSFGPRDALIEVKKLLALPDDERPSNLVFLVTCDVSAKTRQKARTHCAGVMRCHFWTGTELDARVKRYPKIIEEFFGLAVPNIASFQFPDFLVHISHKLASWLNSLPPLSHRYLQAYYSSLATELHTFSFLGHDTPLDLEKIYIALRLSRHIRPDFLPDSSQSELRQSEERSRRIQRYKTIEIETALRRASHLVVLGDPGAGKTTLLRHLALRAAQNDQRLAKAVTRSSTSSHLATSPIPILLTLNDLARDAVPLSEGIVAAFEQHGFPHVGAFIERALGSGHCILLLDGLDEIASKRLQCRLLRDIDALTAAHPGNTIIVTSRIAGFRYLFLTNFTLLEIVEFDREQIHIFLKGWFADNPKQAERLLAILDDRPQMRLLAANPLLLSIIALIYERNLKLPERRVELYERCLWVLVKEWERLKNIRGERRFSCELVLRTLEWLALRFHQNEYVALDYDQLCAQLKEKLPEAIQPQAFLEEVLNRTGLLRQISRSSYAFTHLSLQEFLAAQAIRRQVKQTKDYSMVLNHLEDPWWQETIILLAGIERDATLLIEDILAACPHSLEALLLAVRCLIDADETKAQLRTDVVGRMVEWLKQTDDHRLVEGVEDLADALGETAWTELTSLLHASNRATRIRIVLLLGAIGAQRSIPSLIDTALHDGVSEVRIVASKALRAIGGDTAINPLLAVIQDGEKPSRVRIAAVEALGQIFPTAIDRKACRTLTVLLAGQDSDIRLRASEALRFTFVLVPAGEFLMGAERNNETAQEDDKPQHRLYLEPYYIARYPVTEAQYQRFVTATGYHAPDHWNEKRCPEGKEGLPVVRVSWYDAMAYCKWLSEELEQMIRLPTEAEWEKAASWDPRITRDDHTNARKRKWPWGDIDNYNHTPSPGIGRTVKDYSPLLIGERSPACDSLYGVADMSGNVWEWCSSLLRRYPYRPDDGREDLNASGPRVLRGGSVYDGPIPCFSRDWREPDSQDNFVGFRVAWTPT
jgi:formylglycine-generating enzyme required for sulfatase activity